MVVRVIFAAGRVCNPADITIPVTMLTLTAIVLTNTVTVLTLTLIEITRSATELTLTVIVVVNTVAVLTLTIIVLTLSSIKMTVTRQNLPVWGTAKGMKMPDSPLAAPGLPLHLCSQIKPRSSIPRSRRRESAQIKTRSPCHRRRRRPALNSKKNGLNALHQAASLAMTVLGQLRRMC
jgi:hypothetical protein